MRESSLESLEKLWEGIYVILRTALKLPKKTCMDAAKLAVTASEVVAMESFSPLLLGEGMRELKEKFDLALCVAEAMVSTEFPEEAERKYQDIREEIERFGLGKCWEWTPFFDGVALEKEFGVERGPRLGVFLKQQIVWRLEKPNISKEEMKEKIRKRKKLT